MDPMTPAKPTAQPRPTSLSDFMRLRMKGLLDAVGGFLNRLGLAPISLTLFGLAGHIVAAVVLAGGNMLAGGLLLLFMAPVDALDGTMARLRGQPSDFGAFVDSVTDRYSEVFMFCGLLIHFLRLDDAPAAVLVFLAAAGSVLVSYTRARGEALGYEVRSGMLTRFERYAVLIPTLVFGVPRLGVAVVAVLANVTAVQRFLHVRRQASGR
jgi:CDP-diacylglycerol--glycerol-3-phosphate 3-phosphatidyltransferase